MNLTGSAAALRLQSRFIARGALPVLPLRFPLTFPATKKCPEYFIRPMQREDVHTQDLLEQKYYPPRHREDISVMQQRFDLYPHCSIAACMRKSDLLRVIHSTSLPSWASETANESVMVGCYVCHPLPERMLSSFTMAIDSDVSVLLLQEALRDKSKLMFAQDVYVGVQGLGIGRVLSTTMLGLSKQLGFTQVIGQAFASVVEIWKEEGWKVVRKMQHSPTDISEDESYLVCRDLRS